MKLASDLNSILQIQESIENDIKNYVDTSKARNQYLIKKIQYFLKANSNIPQKILFSGQRGSGKSIVLKQLTNILEPDFYSVNLSISKEIDVSNVVYIDIIIMIFSKLMNELKKQDTRLDPSVLDRLYRYLHDEKLIGLLKFNKSEAGDETGTKVGYIRAISNSIKGVIATSLEMKDKIRLYLEPKLTQLIKGTNDIINALQNIVNKQNKSLLFIIDDFDKMEIDQAANMFFYHSNILTNFQMHIIYTYPLELNYHEMFNKISQNFNMSESLKMIMTINKNGIKNEIGFETIEKIINNRINNNLFAPDVINYFIEKSGGSLNDLFKMIIEAALNSLCLEDKPQYISLHAAKQAYLRVKNNYEISLHVSSMPLETISKYYDNLINKRFIIDDVFINLLKKNLILEYEDDNDGMWYDFHPAVKDILKIK